LELDNVTPVDARLQEDFEKNVLLRIVGGENYKKKDFILNHLSLEMFTKTSHREIFKAIQAVQKCIKNGENIKIDVVEIIAKSKNERIKKYLLELNEEYITNYDADYYVNKLVQNWALKLRREAVTDEEFEKIKNLEQKYYIKNDVCSISSKTGELVMEYFDKWESKPIKTYYPQLDAKIGNLFGGDLIILAGATGMGKTCFMLNLLTNMAEKGIKVLLFSLEMPLRQLQNRIIASRTGINSDKFRKFTMDNFELKKYADYATGEDFKKLQIEVCTKYDLTTADIRNIVSSSDAEIVFIDYLGLIKSDIRGSVYEQVSAISRDLKLIANEVNKPFVVAQQLNRIKQERKIKKPVLSDIRDSGKIEQDADTILFVYREAYYNPALPNDSMTIIIPKSRHTGGRCELKFNYNADTQKIEDKIGEYMESQKQQRLGV
jgi:replicative DNA helicase